MADQQYCLRWNNHQSTLISVFDSLQERGCMVDCTLAAEGQSLQAHKVVLSACSPYLEDLLSKHYDKHPILLLKDVKFEELKAMMDYMYRGEVNVAQDKLNTFLRAAESLQIKGLSDGGTDPPDSGGTTSTKRTAKGTPVSVRSNQLTVRKTNLDDSSSRDGSTSPSQRKRRRRRGSETSDIETSNVSDGKQSTAAAAPVSGPSETSPIVPASAPSDDNILSSITESAETENATDSGFSSAVPQEINNVIRDRDNALIEPKTEYVEDDGQDLNLEDEDGLFRAGPSHARGTYEGDGDDDVYMTNQDSGANAQGNSQSAKRYPWRNTSSKKIRKDQMITSPSQSNLRFKQQVIHEDYFKEKEAADVLTYLSNGSSAPEVLDQAYSDDWLGSDDGENRLDWSLTSQQNKLCKRSPYEGPGSFPCEGCGKIYKWRRTLQNHIKVECGKDPQFQCPYCPLRSKRKGNISAHIKAVHGIE